MDYHQNARLTQFSREQMCRKVVVDGLKLKLAAASFNVSEKTAAKWVRRYRAMGVAGLVDRSSRPGRFRAATPCELAGRVESLRRERWTGQRIANTTGLSRTTVSRILRRLKLNRMRDLDPPLKIERYEHASAGDLLHLDIKRLVCIARPSHRVTGDRRDTVKGVGAEDVHVAIDDHSRIAFSAIYPDETRASVLHFLDAALAYYARLGIHCKAVLTDNGSATAPTPSPTAAANSASSTAASALTPHAPTEKQNASSKRRSGNGPTHASIKTQRNANRPSLYGSTSTTGIDHMLA